VVVNDGDIRTTSVVSVTPETPFKDIVERFVGSKVSALPVADSGERLAGLITDADLICKEGYGGRRHRAPAVVTDVLAREHRWVAKAVSLRRRRSHDQSRRGAWAGRRDPHRRPPDARGWCQVHACRRRRRQDAGSPDAAFWPRSTAR